MLGISRGPLRAILAVAASHAGTPDFVYERHQQLLELLQRSDPTTIEQVIGTIWSEPSAWPGSSEPGKRVDRSVYRR